MRKMKVINMFIICSCLMGMECTAQKNNADTNSCPPEAIAARLAALHAQAVDGDSASASNFLKLFPTSYNEFVSLYGYEGDSFGELYDDSYEHVNFFCNGFEFEMDSLYNFKLIHLTLKGKWQADAVNYLQHCIRIKLENGDQGLISALESRKCADIRLFWLFVFDGPIIEQSDFERFTNNIETPVECIKSAALAAYQNVLERRNE